MCQTCEREDEEDWHVFFECITTINCWRDAGLSSIIEPRLHTLSDAKSLILDICNKEDKRDAGRFAVMMEVLWKNCNNVVWNNDRGDIPRLGLQAYFNWHDWFAAREVQNISISDPSPLTWIPPAVGWIKCNMDVGFTSSHNSTNRGLCFRNSIGSFITAGVAWDVGTMSIVKAEALALKEAMQHAISLNMECVIFESDSQVVVQAVNSNATGCSELSFIFLSIKRMLVSFPNFGVKFVKRQANVVAHSLTKAANSWSRRSSLSIIPSCIEFHLINDMS
ncbi:uncharacterized protein LOC131648802 [Vicia villosa]|uniref:uncharacterized protein LOC131648802 n=1 Tax=Vicia villosa TaxID=3911 RepID=UPI00273B2280|nr:uncharacterized protein LOC131648802 [Vicia villosa]